MQRRRILPIVVWLVAATLAVCGCKKKRIIICEPGQIVVNLACVWPDGGDVSEVDLGEGDSSVVDSAPNDVGTADAADLEPIDETSPDTSDAKAEPGKVGDPCIGDNTCETGLCLLSPGGYCSISPCNDDCPSGAACLVLGTVKACFKECTSGSDCREKDGYACKTEIARQKPPLYKTICRPTGDGKTGASCQVDSDCEGESTCLTTLKKGYCAKVNCAANSDCASDERCVRVEGIPSCMKLCGSSTECRQEDNHECVTATDIEQATVSICSMKEGTAQIGDPCEVNLDCVSKQCEILATGICNDADKSFCKTHQDCPVVDRISGVCTQTKVVGMCVSECTPFGDPCPNGDVCASSGTGYRCLKACSDGGDCRSDANFQCLVGGTDANGSFACVLADRIVGASCVSSYNCADGQICRTGFPAGYCTLACPGGSADCPFPGVCVTVGSEAICAKRCLFDTECRTDYECKSVLSSAKVCWPKAL
ncbi:MAG: hypothetical protein KC609_14880 [Myxococcales bacterium]|nr:hypothetical protein [Myxococcales bacterium]